jgi:hypothetical protein
MLRISESRSSVRVWRKRHERAVTVPTTPDASRDAIDDVERLGLPGFFRVRVWEKARAL